MGMSLDKFVNAAIEATVREEEEAKFTFSSILE